MILNELLKQGDLETNEKHKLDIDIYHICCDSRLAGPNSIFVCIKGAVTDGHLYALSAYNRGCRCFVVEYDPHLPNDCNVIYTNDSRLALARLADILYDHPSRKLKVIGITGTKGKTTTALMISGVLNTLGIPTGYIGSNGIQYGDFRHSSANTTPESCDIQRYLHDMVDSGIKYAVIEVSSQALYLGRVKYVHFDTCVFTNLSPDHIGEHEHPNFEHYRACKASLFSDYNPRRVLVNADDQNSEFMLCNCKVSAETFGIHKTALHTAENIVMYKADNALGMSFDYVCENQRIPLTINFPGEYSISNALAAIAICRGLCNDTQAILNALSKITVEGRFEIVPALPYATIIIDYAHNGISMCSVLETLRMYVPHRIITLFGSVGSRTYMRRAELGLTASRLSDYCILTSDNPDGESPYLIIRDIAAAFDPNGCEYKEIVDRREAIIYAMSILQPGDILLLAGKGHEDYQLVGGHKIPFCEREIVLETAKKMMATSITNK